MKVKFSVALSRVTSRGNLFLVGKYNYNVLKVNENAVVEYIRLPENRFHIIYADYIDNNNLTVCLLITRSLKKHAADINRRLTENNILCLTDSQITNDSDAAEFIEQLYTFKIYFNSFGVRYQNLAFYKGQNIVFLKHYTFHGISVIEIPKDSFSLNTIQIMLLYLSPSSSLTTFYNTLKNLLSENDIIDIVLGDLNTDILSNANISLQHVLFNYT